MAAQFEKEPPVLPGQFRLVFAFITPSMTICSVAWCSCFRFSRAWGSWSTAATDDFLGPQPMIGRRTNVRVAKTVKQTRVSVQVKAVVFR